MVDGRTLNRLNFVILEMHTQWDKIPNAQYSLTFQATVVLALCRVAEKYAAL